MAASAPAGTAAPGRVGVCSQVASIDSTLRERCSLSGSAVRPCGGAGSPGLVAIVVMSNDSSVHSSGDLEAITDAVLGVSRVLVSIASRSLGDVADEVTLAQYRALVVLQSRGPQSANALASELQIAPSTATRLCDRLVAKSLVARRTPEANRREVRLMVTEAGAAIVGEVSRRRRVELRKVVTAMADRDRAELVRSLEEFNRAAGETPENGWYLGWA